ncbi:MAG: hypothetical protein Q9164_007509, partial [Protoblastenia rupestris]
MLDPVSAVSLAGNVVQFVQFGCNIIAKTHETYTSKSGVLKENLETETVTTRLLETVEELESGCKRVASSPKTTTERRLVEIAEACTLIARDVLSRLEKLKTKEPRSILSSVSRALKSAWSEEELKAMTKRLKAYISELDTTILISMKRNVDLQSLRMSSDFYRLGEASQRIVDLLLLNRSIFTSELHVHTSEIKDVIVDEQARTRELILNLVQQKGIIQETSASYVQSTSSSGTTESCADGTDRTIWSWLLDSLGFAAMRNRQEEIAPAHHATFEWIFPEPSNEPDTHPWKNFV